MERWCIGRESPEGREYVEPPRGRHVVDLAPDGSFRLDDVPPGEYRLAVASTKEPLATATRAHSPGRPSFTVPPSPGDGATSRWTSAVRLRPRFRSRSASRRPRSRSTTSREGSSPIPGRFPGEIPPARLRHDLGHTGGHSDRPAERRPRKVRQGPAVRDGQPDLRGRQRRDAGVSSRTRASPGPRRSSVRCRTRSPAYAVDDENVPATILIGPDGRIVAKDLWNDEIAKAVGEALKEAAR